jgi:hypothetical protein
MDEVIPQADVIFVSAPDTPISYKMMGGEAVRADEATLLFHSRQSRWHLRHGRAGKGAR